MAVSTSRHEKAQLTRRRICDAARELFLAHGYTATTITDVAKAAGVAQQTVYFVFRSKAGLLSAIMDAEIVGDARPVPLLERPEAARVSGIADPARRLEQVVAVAADITERLAPLYEIVRSGAADDDVRELLERHEEQRWRTLRALIAGLDPRRLAGGVDLDQAADRLYVLASHEVYWLLVRRREWPASRWRDYVTAEALRQLLAS